MLKFISHFYGNFLFLSQLITLSSGEVRLYFLEIDLKKQINLLETLLFCLFYICSTRSLLPLSPGTGFTYFLLTATQPRLRTSCPIISQSFAKKYVCLSFFDQSLKNIFQLTWVGKRWVRPQNQVRNDLQTIKNAKRQTRTGSIV